MKEEEETIQERQSNELEALKAIFTDQFVDCNEGSTEWKPLNIILTVFPPREHSGPPEIYVQLDLHVIACEKYPDKVPKLILENVKGISDKQVADMQNKLEDIALSKVGEVIVFELVQHIQTVLTECNKPGFQSCYEEMLSRKKEREQKEVEMQQTELDRQRQLIELEVHEIRMKRLRKKRGLKSAIDLNYFNDITAVVADAPNREQNNVDPENLNGQKNMDGATDTSSDSLTHIISLFDKDSRLVKEFEVLNFIGKGAFGDVLKARNKLDGRFYAIKIIPLKLKDKQRNKKIKREVKFLSRLNHENVVRYYNAWIENQDLRTEESSEEGSDYLSKNRVNKNGGENLTSKNLNLSFQFPKADPSFSDEDEDDEDDDNDWIEFNDENDEADGVQVDSYTYSDDNEEESITNQCMYIQMEYCEKSTLRSAIDSNLYKNENRVWRLLKEVVEGLAYIHEQGIIHRDLKPVNIFIDSNDHVKIGDFGLATPNKPSMKIETFATDYDNEKYTQHSADATHTGQVGTALYVAPELNTCEKVHYNQKVDIYSLGIIFFEMNYPPFSTQMERLKVLSDLRTDKIIFPQNCINNPKWCKQIKLISTLLHHTPAERPSAKGILEQSYIPCTEFEDEKLVSSIRHTMSNPQSKMYKHLISQCFNQKVSAAEDITYNTSIHQKSAWHHAFIEKLAANARKIFRLHGGTYFSSPFLTPNSGIGIADSGQPATLMNRCGIIVNAPYDLRLSFARYLAQNPQVMHMKRYVVDKVFRERRMLGTHPKETYECAFDIVGPDSGNLAMEAELLSIICEFLDSSSEVVKKNYVIRLNHVALVTAILYHHHLTAKKHQFVCDLLSRMKYNYICRNRGIVGNEFLSEEVSDSDFNNVVEALNVEIAPNKMISHFSNMMKKSSKSSAHCKAALNALEQLVRYLTALKIKCPILIAPNIMSNYQFYSGIMFQVVWEQKKKTSLEYDIIATGGRYDNLIRQYRNALHMVKDTKQSATGLTIYLDRLTNVLQKKRQLFSTVDVLVCSVGVHSMTEEKLKLMKELWGAEIRSTILDVEQSLEETQEYCARMNIPHILFIKDSEPGVVRIRSLVKDRFHERRLNYSEIVPHVCRILKSPNSIASLYMEHPIYNHHHSRSESRSASVSVIEAHSVNVTFLTEEKITPIIKRRYENLVNNTILGNLSKISTKCKIEVLLLNVPFEVIKLLAATVDLSDKYNDDYLGVLLKRYPKHKNCLHRVTDRIEKLKTLDVVPVIVLYCVEDNNFKILI